MHKFKTIIEDTTSDVEVNEETFKQAMDQLPTLITEWRYEKDAELVRMMNTDITYDKPQSSEAQRAFNREQLELATTWFQCKHRCGSISYPRILIHSCTHDVRYTWGCPDNDDLRPILWEYLRDEPWNRGGERVGYNARTEIVGRLVVESCGLDPDTTTAEAMDDLDARIECLTCISETSGRLIMGWRVAVRYPRLMSGFD
jgi:hypothetical protein